MLEMLKERKAALEAQGKKGFTLMEMLIVIAIIAILIAIAIPIFTHQMDAAKQATDESNGRALYAQLQANYMLKDASGNWTAPANGSIAGGANATITYDGSTYKFSDKCTNIQYTEPSGSVGPKLAVTSNGKTLSFPDNPTGSAAAAGGNG